MRQQGINRHQDDGNAKRHEPPFARAARCAVGTTEASKTLYVTTNTQSGRVRIAVLQGAAFYSTVECATN